ncbi:hypothetical protein [Sutcliffiella halmapala]|uniref:hypothetical protein n=1 Tax=Sutcliffiella halmapala TaxID=79882 RepID=UPI0009951370|nr:hypothetical protein [Sutcliffiella halmapala]
MAVVEDLHRVTTHLLTMLEEEFPAEDKRDPFIEEVEKLLQIRESLLQRLAPPFTEAEIELGKKVAQASQLIPVKLEAFQKQLKQEWSHMQHSKKTAKAYEKAYAGVSIDGMYYDKRN